MAEDIQEEVTEPESQESSDDYDEYVLSSWLRFSTILRTKSLQNLLLYQASTDANHWEKIFIKRGFANAKRFENKNVEKIAYIKEGF